MLILNWNPWGICEVYTFYRVGHLSAYFESGNTYVILLYYQIQYIISTVRCESIYAWATLGFIENVVQNLIVEKDQSARYIQVYC